MDNAHAQNAYWTAKLAHIKRTRDIAELVECGDEHIARDTYGDELVDAYFTAEGWNVTTAR